jgi:hypothetical protein
MVRMVSPCPRILSSSSSPNFCSEEGERAVSRAYLDARNST